MFSGNMSTLDQRARVCGCRSAGLIAWNKVVQRRHFGGSVLNSHSSISSREKRSYISFYLKYLGWHRLRQRVDGCQWVGEGEVGG